MKKIINKGLLATALAVVLSIGMFSALFIGANTIAFAAANNREVNFPSSAHANSAVRENVIPAGYQTPSISVTENEFLSTGVKTANTISPEEAAELGAQYIWDIFEASIDGKTVEMVYTSFPSSTRNYWHGSVTYGTEIRTGTYFEFDAETEIYEETEYEIEVPKILFSFSLDAVTGERMDITQSFAYHWELGLVLDFDETMELIKKYDAMSGEFLPIAEKYAQKHFNNTAVISVEFEHSSVISETQANMSFIATDETGREAKVLIDIHSRQLVWVDTRHNDIIPGFDYGWTEGEIPF